MSGWGALGDVLGGGFNTDAAYESGRLRTAQTENALESARSHQLDNMGKEFKAKNQAGFEEALMATGQYTAEEARMIATTSNAGLGSEFADTTRAMGYKQHQDFLAQAASPEASLGDQVLALQGASGNFIDRTANEGGAMWDRTAPFGSQVLSTPEAQSRIAENQAQEYATMHPELKPGGANDAYEESYGKPESGQMRNKAFDPLQPLSSTNSPYLKRPDAVDPPAPIGSRERGMLASVTHGVIEGTQHLNTIMNQSAGADTGILGSGVFSTHGVGLLQATSNNLRQALGSTEVKQYNTLMGGQARNAAFIENFGRVPTDGQIASVQSQITFMPGDSTDIEAKMMKAASYRNIIENGVRTFLAIYGNNPDTPPDLIQLMKEADANVKRVVPYTMDDVNALGSEPGKSLLEVTKKRMLNGPVRAGGTPAATGTSPSPQTGGLPRVTSDADYDALPPGTLFIDPEGHKRSKL